MYLKYHITKTVLISTKNAIYSLYFLKYLSQRIYIGGTRII